MGAAAFRLTMVPGLSRPATKSKLLVLWHYKRSTKQRASERDDLFLLAVSFLSRIFFMIACRSARFARGKNGAPPENK
jgi:hypothetical protein